METGKLVLLGTFQALDLGQIRLEECSAEACQGRKVVLVCQLEQGKHIVVRDSTKGFFRIKAISVPGRE